MSATEQAWPVSPPEVYAEYDLGVLWTEIDGKQEWPRKVLSTKVARYPWPHGIQALMVERENVAKIEALRLNFERGQYVNPGKSIGTATRIFTMPLSFNEAFVGSDMQRIKLMDIVRNCMNFEWKCDAAAEINLSRKASKKADGSRTTSAVYHDVREWEFERQFANLRRDAEELFKKRIDDVILLQGLTQELKPETLELIKRCKSHEQLARCMLDANFGCSMQDPECRLKVQARRFGTRAPMTDLTHGLEDVLRLQGLGTRAPMTDLTHGLEDVLVVRA